MGTSDGVMVRKLDEQTYMSEFESNWVSHSLALCQIEAKSFVNYYICCSACIYNTLLVGTSGGVMVRKLDEQTYKSEFESNWVSHSLALCQIEAKSFVNYYICCSACIYNTLLVGTSGGVMVSKLD